MVRPEEVAHRNYMIWEQTIDAYLRGHTWQDSRSCTIALSVSPQSLDSILSRYTSAGWHVTHDGEGYTFTLPESLTLDEFS